MENRRINIGRLNTAINRVSKWPHGSNQQLQKRSSDNETPLRPQTRYKTAANKNIENINKSGSFPSFSNRYFVPSTGVIARDRVQKDTRHYQADKTAFQRRCSGQMCCQRLHNGAQWTLSSLNWADQPRLDSLENGTSCAAGNAPSPRRH